MVSGTSLRDQIAQKVQGLKDAAGGYSESAAGRQPAAGEWSVREVLSHLCGEEGENHASGFRRLLDEDTPLFELDPGKSNFTPERQKMTTSELLSVAVAQYNELGAFLAGLNEEQLSRKARVPLLKDSPLGEYVTMAQLAGALVDYHLNEHINQISSARQQQ
jgi:hypothetical protein